jgi:hypothetical protein
MIMIIILEGFTSRVSRASPMVLNIWLPSVKFIAKQSKFAPLAQEISIPPPNSCSLPAGERRNTVVHLPKAV